ncbi:MAG TPA: hypothetical protein VNX15_07125 [Gemmatimonadales bacterium]|jgi:hypothetical protein|nr:hypothetical protein [Gemmatimonadales bacterium]
MTGTPDLNGASRGSRGWVLAAFLVTFLAGAAVDHGITALHRRGPWGTFGHPGAGAGGGARPNLVAMLTRELDLSAVQQDSARAIFARHRCDLRDIWRTAHPRFDSLRARVDSELSAVLNPDQRAKFQSLAGRHDHRPPMPPAADSGCAGS